MSEKEVVYGPVPPVDYQQAYQQAMEENARLRAQLLEQAENLWHKFAAAALTGIAKDFVEDVGSFGSSETESAHNFALMACSLADAMMAIRKQGNMSTPKILTASEIVVPGFYWWLPECSKHEPDKPENWSIQAWHPHDSLLASKKGLFVGPLSAPVFKREKGTL